MKGIFSKHTTLFLFLDLKQFLKTVLNQLTSAEKLLVPNLCKTCFDKVLVWFFSNLFLKVSTSQLFYPVGILGSGPCLVVPLIETSSKVRTF